MISQWEKTLHGFLGGNGILKKLNQASRRKNKHTIKAFWWFKGDIISQWIPKFYLCDESNPINPQCGKISANFYISPPHPPHPQFYPQKWWKFRYTSWLTQKNCISIDLRGAQVNHFWNKQRYLMPEGINARVSRYYICWHSITIVCYTFVQQLEICN